MLVKKVEWGFRRDMRKYGSVFIVIIYTINLQFFSLILKGI